MELPFVFTPFVASPFGAGASLSVPLTDPVTDPFVSSEEVIGIIPSLSLTDHGTISVLSSRFFFAVGTGAIIDVSHRR